MKDDDVMSGRRVVIDNLTEVELHHIRLGLEILVELAAREGVTVPEQVALRDRVQKMCDQERLEREAGGG